MSFHADHAAERAATRKPFKSLREEAVLNIARTEAVTREALDGRRTTGKVVLLQ